MAFFLDALDDYAESIEPVVRFLQGQDPSLALRIVNRTLLPEGPAFYRMRENQESLLDQHFGDLGLADKAKYLASIYIEDIATVIREGVDPRFEFSRYGESLASSQTSFSTLEASLELNTLIDDALLSILDEHIARVQPDLIGFSAPFPGNVYAALKMGQHIRKKYKHIQTVMGGGYVNTELRDITDPRIFRSINYLTYDDGETPIVQLVTHLMGHSSQSDLVRTKYLRKGEIVTSSNITKDRSFKEVPAPDYSGLPLRRYLSLMMIPNAMNRLWSEFRWNKLVLAHGCYWKRCSFCDTHLDYIGRFEPQRVETLVQQIETVMAQTGSSGFHFVDEAAPPALLKALSEELIRRKIKISWWGNLRFDIQFTQEVAQKMADAGCVAVTGGLEVASDRLLKLMNKGVTVEQVANVTQNFKKAGIFVHAYLMYGFPTQTKKETVESLENVRRLFELGCLDSAHWHRFLATAHSPVGREPQKFKIQLAPRPTPKEGLFARYEIPFHDPVKTDHDTLGLGLRRALYNYMHGVGLEKSAQSWFEAD